MFPAAERFAAELAAMPMRKPRIAFWSPVDSAVHNELADIQALLRRQLASPVRWADLIRALAGAGATTFVECGPGKVLTGLGRRIDKQLECLALQDPDSVQATKTTLEART